MKGYEIITPFMDRHNDHILIYVQSKAGGTYELHDDGYTIADLALPGRSLTATTRQTLDAILRGFDVSEKNQILFVEADNETLELGKNALLKAIVTVNDVFNDLLRHRCHYLLGREEVAAWTVHSGGQD